MSDRPSFLDELKRRKVVRVALVYGAVAWAVLQVADIVVPALGLPAQMVTAVVLLVLLGFPIALVVAWAFDVTPTGVMRTERADATDAPQDARSPGWLSLRAVLAAVVLVAAGWLGGRFLHAGGGGNGAATSSDLPSVAVLPFENLGTADSAHFADGVQDDILTQLARISGLRVTSRTSTEKYRGSTADVPTIAHELKVEAILEGGVQRTADQVHMNVQLIDGATDEHLWAETYDRALTAEDVFSIQAEIARKVAEALKATLTPEDEKTLAEVPTRDLEALDLYHRAGILFGQGGLSEQAATIPLLEAAVARDSTFARAWAELVSAYSWQIRAGQSGDTLPARAALDHLRALAPGGVDAITAEANYLYYARGDFQGALQALQRLGSRQANQASFLSAKAFLLRRVGRWDEALAALEELVRLEPENASAWANLGATNRFMRRFPDAEAAWAKALAIAPDYGAPAAGLVDLALWADGDTAHARSLLPGVIPVGFATGMPEVLEADLDAIRRDRRALEIAARAKDPGVNFGWYYEDPSGSVLLWRVRLAWSLGDTAEARRLSAGLERDYVERTPVLGRGGPPVPAGSDMFDIGAGLHIMRGWMAAVDGDGRAALAEADSAMSMYPPEADALEGVDILRHRADIRLVAGDYDGALEDLRRVLGMPSTLTGTVLRLGPFYDPLRSRRDFQALVEEGG